MGTSAIVSESSNNPGKIVDALMKAALDAGGRDNVSIAIGLV